MRYVVKTEVFEGPFDLLLHLIARQRLDLWQVSLSRITEDYLAEIKRMQQLNLEVATEFLVVAATLLELKAARLLPSPDADPDEAEALLEERDLLFARLLQYRAYKQAAAVFAGRMADEAGRFARAVTLEPQLAGLLPEVLLGLGPQEFAALAARAFAPKPVPYLSIAHLHAPTVSVCEQAAILVTTLRRSRRSTFRQLTVDCEGTLVVVARFLALLELYREGAVAFEQVDPLGELYIRWTGSDEGEVEVPDEFDEDVVAVAEPADDEPSDDQPSHDQTDTTIDLRETSTDDHA